MSYVLALYVVASLAAFVTYGVDKRAARLGRSRVPEARLHALELAGGWPGALAAQTVFRHKRRKTSFMLVFWAIVVLHGVAWIAWAGWRAGWFESRA